MAGFIFRTTPSGSGAASRAVLGRTLIRWVERGMSWHRGCRDRQVLAALDDRMLRDIGIDRATAGSEHATWFWRLR
jgi:uncharacterized protein YjiS (DUF1127 family)